MLRISISLAPASACVVMSPAEEVHAFVPELPRACDRSAARRRPSRAPARCRRSWRAPSTAPSRALLTVCCAGRLSGVSRCMEHTRQLYRPGSKAQRTGTKHRSLWQTASVKLMCYFEARGLLVSLPSGWIVRACCYESSAAPCPCFAALLYSRHEDRGASAQ